MYYSFFLSGVHEYLAPLPHQLVLAKSTRPTLIEPEGVDLSPRELQGRYSVALQTIGGEDLADRQKPIYRRSSGKTEQQAIEDAAQALRALWKIRKPA